MAEGRSLRAFAAGLVLAAAVTAGVHLAFWARGWRMVRVEEPAAEDHPSVAGDVPPQRRKAAMDALEAGNAAIIASRWDEAVEQAERSLQLDPTLSEAHKLLGLAHWKKNDACRGREHFLAYMKLSPGDGMNARIERILQNEEMQACAK